MNRDLDTALDECLVLLRAGADYQVCLARYPQYSGQLEGLLKLAARLRAIRTPAPADTAIGERRMLDALRNHFLF